MMVTARLASGRTVPADAFADLTKVKVTAVEFDGNGDLAVTFDGDLDDETVAAVRRRITSGSDVEERNRSNLAAGIAAIQAARDAALKDIEDATALRGQALAVQAASVLLRNAIADFKPSPTYNSGDLAAIRDAFGSVLGQQELILGALADGYAYRIGVDANAVVTDNALLWLAGLAANDNHSGE